MDYREFAKWLANKDSNGANDYEFAEFFVYLKKVIEHDIQSPDDLTVDDMRNFDVEGFTKWLKESLYEIIFDEELCDGAWWKGE